MTITNKQKATTTATATKKAKSSKSINSKQKGLVIGRQPGESIIIGDAIRIQVYKEEHGLIRLRIEAPKEIGITREELFGNKDLTLETLQIQVEEAIKNQSIKTG